MRHISLIILIGSLLAIPGCKPAPQRQLVIANTGGVLGLDPHIQDETVTVSVLANVYEGLVGFDPAMKIIPQLAKGYANLSDTTWRFYLRPGVKFHDGKTMTADDVVYSLQRAARDPRSVYQGMLAGIASVRMIDSLSVEITTKRPQPTLINTLTIVAIVPCGCQPSARAVGTGPYRLEDNSTKMSMRLAAFRDYWGEQPYFRRVEFISIPDGNERAQALLQHLVDMDASVSEDQRGRFAGRADIQLMELPIESVWMLGLSLKGPAKTNPLADRRVRRALSLAVDRRALIDQAYAGNGEPADQLVPATIFGFDPGLPPMRRDIDSAKGLLREAGVRDSLRLSLSLSLLYRAVGTLLQRQLSQAGIALTLDSLNWPLLYQKIEEGRAGFYLVGFSFGFGDASEIINDLHTRGGGEFGHRNTSGYSNPKLDVLIEAAAREFDLKKRQAFLQQAMGVVVADLPFIPLYAKGNCYGLRSGLSWTPRSDELVLAREIRPADRQR